MARIEMPAGLKQEIRDLAKTTAEGLMKACEAQLDPRRCIQGMTDVMAQAVPSLVSIVEDQIGDKFNQAVREAVRTAAIKAVENLMGME